MTDLDDLFARSRESRDWDLPTESRLASIAIRRGRRRRRWHAAGAGAAAALVAITVIVSIRAGTNDPSSDAAHRDSLIAQNRAEVLAQKRSALEAWELAGADTTVMALTNVNVPLVPRPEQETAANDQTIHSASSRDISVGFVGGPIDGPCAWDYEARAIETAHGVVVTVFGHARSSTPIACTLEGLSRTTVVTMDAPLGDRALFDGATGRHLPDSTYAPTFPTPIRSTTATVSAACGATGYGKALTGNCMVP
jgi:hypothetical protein